MSIDMSSLLSFPVHERISLIKALADSLESDIQESGSLTEEQIEETNRFIQQIDKGQINLSSWDDARARIIRGA